MGWQDAPLVESKSKWSSAPVVSTEAETEVPGAKPSEPTKAAGGLANFYGPHEAALTAVTGAVGSLAGQVAGIARTVTGGKFGTQEGIKQGQETAASIAGAMTYRPRTELGQRLIADIGKIVDKTKIAGLGPAEAVAASTLAPAAVAQAAGKVARAIPDTPVAPFQDEMVGVGAAQASGPALRVERAAQLPVPIQLTKGQATRQFAQQQFEREAAKNPTIGEPLRQRYADQNQRILQNFDSWLDQTGAEAGSLRAAGEAVDRALVMEANKAKMAIRGAYQKAESAGEMRGAVDVRPLTQWLESHKPEAINAPVISSAEAKLAQIVKNGQASIGDLEEVRKMVGNLGQKDATNALYSRQIKGVIDSLTEGVGGEEYKRARSLRAQYAKRFEDVAVIDRLMSTRPGSKDRAVAYEDVFRHTILSGSLDDVREVRRALQTSGPAGQQAWKELQGQTIQHFKDEITKNVATDIKGNPVVSAANLNKLVTSLDKDGKLDFIFGKQGAQQLRDVNEISKDVLTSVPGSINHSNTASIVIAALDTILSGATGLPLPIGTATRYGVKKYKDVKLTKQVADALDDPLPGMLR